LDDPAQILREPVQRPGGVLVGPDLERVLTLELEEARDLLQDAGDDADVCGGLAQDVPRSG